MAYGTRPHDWRTHELESMKSCLSLFHCPCVFPLPRIQPTTPLYFPTVVNHAASARWLAAPLLPHPLPVSTTSAVGPGEGSGRGRLLRCDRA